MEKSFSTNQPAGAAIVVNNLVKRYGAKKETVAAVRGISFQVERGELFGIIGPDGAGKTSLFRMLTTLLLPDAGSATVNGLDVVKDFKTIRRQVGYMPGKFSLYQDLTVAENLEFFATIFNTTVTANYALIKDIYSQIEPFRERRAGKLSGGMKQKLALSCALIHKPVVLFLDEPTTGVDVVSRKEFWEMLKQLKQQGITILVSTPYMDEASLCDRVALMQDGQLLRIDTPQGIIDQYGKPLLAVKSNRMLPLQQDLKAFDQVEDCHSFGEYHHVVMKPGYQLDSLRQYLESKQHGGLEIRPISPGIEDCFMDLMKHTATQTTTL
ncbi:MAG: ABC transporter ATP-binding protein [Candidatus Pseudobacter hemicellulosilyticus]|uniref:ABC transporter ATP-binding protein n=1 Tax=Candidatus Pseudobacter hemicellulosilyticus TaxID=3121375 RepID=A0AAJ5WSF0_9BACT|nr:MAG: ABC transporter ATP-binding protein [Pseudobacter sp.]